MQLPWSFRRKPKHHKRILIGVTVIVILLFTSSLYLYTSGEWEVFFNIFQHAYFQLQYKPPQAAASKIDVLTVPSNTLQVDKEMRVYLPPGYDASQDRYPVLYLLHGDPGDSQDWLVDTNLQQVLDDKIAQKLLPPLIVVFPDGNGPVVKDSQYLDVPAQKMESYIVNDVRTFIDGKYRTLTASKYRAIGGVSSGAFGALNIAVHHPDLYHVVILHSPYAKPVGQSKAPLIGNNAALMKLNSPIEQLPRTASASSLAIYIDAGDQDFAFITTDYNSLVKAFTTNHLNFQSGLISGAHGWGTWRVAILKSLDYLGQQWLNLLIKPSLSPSSKSVLKALEFKK